MLLGQHICNWAYYNTYTYYESSKIYQIYNHIFRKTFVKAHMLKLYLILK